MTSPAFPVAVRLAAIPHPRATNSSVTKRKPDATVAESDIAQLKARSRTTQHPGNTKPIMELQRLTFPSDALFMRSH
jgi:hypothetical protein